MVEGKYGAECYSGVRGQFCRHWRERGREREGKKKMGVLRGIVVGEREGKVR